jgi:hypothetical protein
MATRCLSIKSTTSFPQNIHTWKISKEDNKIIAETTSKATKRKRWEFKYKEGMLYLFNSTSNAYAYFRTEDFCNFMKEHNLQKYTRKDPNIVYHITNWYDTTSKSGKIFNSSSSNLITDGVIECKDKVDISKEETKKKDGHYQHDMNVIVKNAIFVIIETTNYNYNESIVFRELITLKNYEELNKVFEMKELII